MEEYSNFKQIFSFTVSMGEANILLNKNIGIEEDVVFYRFSTSILPCSEAEVFKKIMKIE